VEGAVAVQGDARQRNRGFGVGRLTTGTQQ